MTRGGLSRRAPRSGACSEVDLRGPVAKVAARAPGAGKAAEDGSVLFVRAARLTPFLHRRGSVSYALVDVLCLIGLAGLISAKLLYIIFTYMLCSVQLGLFVMQITPSCIYQSSRMKLTSC